MSGLRVCVDVGSTWTKAMLVDPDAVRSSAVTAADGELRCAGIVATAQHRTTIDTDVMDGLSGVLTLLGEQVGAHPVAFGDPLVCSSAGGGLRLAVVGYERAVTAEAARRAAVSAGGRVVHLAHGLLVDVDVAALLAARPDVVVLTGGTDGGDGDVLLANAAALAGPLAAAGLPVVLAGNAEVAEQAHDRLSVAGVEAQRTANVLPKIGRYHPLPAREAVRAAFLHHVIGGDRLSRGRGFAELVRAATPDVVLAGVQSLATAYPGGVLVVDVGGATTDVYSVLSQAALESVDGDVAGTEPASRTVEGDLGMRVSATGVGAAAVTENLTQSLSAPLEPAVLRALAAQTSSLGEDDRGRAMDTDLAMVAALTAVRRHARAGAQAPRPLRDVELVVGSGGVLRHGDVARTERVLGAVCRDHAGMWHVPDAARSVVDRQYVLCALGLLGLT